MREIAGDVFSTEVRVAFGPESAYRSLVAADEAVGVWHALRRPALVATVIGTAVPIMAVQRVTLGLIAVSTVSFSVFVAIQIAVGAALAASTRSHGSPLPRALDLWFAGHLPYSVWLLTMAAVIATLPAAGLDMLIASAAIPAAWTAFIVAAFCRNVLKTTRTAARWLAFAHFAIIWTVAFELVAWGAGGWFQVTRSVTALFT